MPELPVVEVVVRQLQQFVGKRINSVEILHHNVMDANLLNTIGKKIKKIERRGKAIIFHLNKNYLLAHLRMTGHFVIGKENKYFCGGFMFENSYLGYHSIRKFGGVKLINKQELTEFHNRLGFEPLTSSSSTFIKTIQKYPNSPIKNKLLNQSVIAGIGNIYAMESLYAAGILPQKKIGDISKIELSELDKHIKRILKLAIINNGSTVDNYRNIDGKGNFQNMLKVYQKEKCPKKHKLTKIKLAGRGTYYCDKCQK